MTKVNLNEEQLAILKIEYQNLLQMEDQQKEIIKATNKNLKHLRVVKALIKPYIPPE
jgi:hypothetical protein